jgi:hypothetical protein
MARERTYEPVPPRDQMSLYFRRFRFNIEARYQLSGLLPSARF